MLCTFFLVQPDGDTATTSTSYGKLGKLLVMELRKTEFDPDECQGIKVGANVSVNKNIRFEFVRENGEVFSVINCVTPWSWCHQRALHWCT